MAKLWEAIRKIACILCNAKTEALPVVPKPEPVIRRTIDRDDLSLLLRSRFPKSAVFFSDPEKSLCDIEDINAFLKVDETNQRKYIKHKFDCDDFTYMLMGQFSVPAWAPIAKGICWTDVHAMMICVDANEDIWFIEPQSDNVKPKLDDWQGKTAYVIMM